MGADLLSETLARLNNITPRPQRDAEATFAPVLKREDGLIDWAANAVLIERSVRGFQPWPNAYTYFRGERLIVWHAAVVSDSPALNSADPGEITVAQGDDMVVKSGAQTSLRLLELQPEGKRRMKARDFLNGAHLRAGERLG